VGRWVMEQAARQAQAWAAGPSGVSGAPIGVTVNVSARQLSQYDFPEMTESILGETGVSPELLTLEITEGALMRDVDAAWSVLRRVKTLGLSLALDDFGTGFSSLSFLRRFDLDMVKIDKSLVDGIGQSREDTTIVKHLIGMAQGLGLVTVAEGVETEGQAQYLARLECPLAQGYYYARPQPVAAIERILDWQASTVSTPSIGVGPGSVDTVGQGSV